MRFYVVGLQEHGFCAIGRSDCLFTNRDRAYTYAKSRGHQVFTVTQAKEDLEDLPIEEENKNANSQQEGN